jgi:hypothetical protein
MSEHDLLKRTKMRVHKPSDKKKVPPQGFAPAVFSRCSCPQCGKRFLRLRGFCEPDQRFFMGVTGDGILSVGNNAPGRECDHTMGCEACGYSVSLKNSDKSDGLLEWARSQGQEIEPLKFTCPVCGAHKLLQVETQVEIHSEIEAVHEIVWDNAAEKQPVVALALDLLLRGEPSTRYRCENGHELAKDDGTPVENAEELVAWLKARSAIAEG